MKKILLTCITLLVCIFSNHAQTIFSAKQTINASTGANPYAIDSGELSGDAYKDIVIGTFGNTIEYYENNGDGTFASAESITTTLDGISYVLIADLDGVNGNDILVSSYNNDKLLWYPNDGSGNFITELEIYTAGTVDGPGAMVTGFIDAGTTLDVAVVGYLSGDTVWFSNNGSGVFTGPNTIASVASSGPGDIDLADFDGDGDLDALVANTDAGNIEIYDNNLIPGGSVSFTKYTNSVSTGNDYLFDASFAQVNDDPIGNLDIVKADIGGAGDVSYIIADSYPLNPLTTTFTEILVSTGTSIARPATAAVADFDNDGFNDVASSNAGTAGSDLEWFESTDIGTFNTVVEIDNSQNIVYSVTVDDFDNDGDQDIATIDYQNNDLNWFENLLETLSTESFNQEEISIFPNPTKNILNFKVPFAESFKISVYDILGKKVLSSTLQNTNLLDVSRLNNGIYILKFDDFNTNLKFVKQ